jgi:hypothetical protein
MKTRAAFLTAVGLLTMGASSAHEYATGQVWTYHTRPGEQSSRLQINKVEQDPKLGTIFHISVFGIRVLNPRTQSVFTNELPHVPVSKETLDKSVVSLSSDPARAVDYESGYAAWKQAHGGVYTISVAEIVASAELTLAKTGH